MARQEIVRKTNPANGRWKPGLCASCRIEIPLVEDQDFCQDCQQSLREQEENQTALREAYLERREREVFEQEEEWEERREQRREERRQENERYQQMKDQERYDKEAEDKKDWYECLRFLGSRGA